MHDIYIYIDLHVYYIKIYMYMPMSMYMCVYDVCEGGCIFIGTPSSIGGWEEECPNSTMAPPSYC